MKHEKLSAALNEISDAHIAEAAASKKKVKLPWLGAVAAILALAILITSIGRPSTASAEGLIAAPVYPETGMYGRLEGLSTEGFFRESLSVLLGDGEETVVCSPLNIYMALAMLAETTAGQTQQQILTLLGSDDLDHLRTQASKIWNAHYQDDENATTLLSNSLWLDNAFSYNEDTVSTLVESYYASVYRGDLGSKQVNKLLRDWLNDQTKDLLKDQAQDLSLSQNALLALASTIYYEVPWFDDFNEVNNFEDVFYTPQGEVTTTYMYKSILDSPYYRGDNFGAVAVRLLDGSKLWLILPDESYTTSDVLAEGTYLDMLYDADYDNYIYALVNLSLPKFDVAADMDLVDALQSMGLTDVFDPAAADFSPILPGEENGYVHEISHAARVIVDEEGIIGAAYTVIETDAAADYADVINFVLNRPFIFCVQSRNDQTLFAGVVSSP